MLLEWRDEYRTGVAAVDYEHRELIELINESHDRMTMSGASQDVGAFLGEINARISAHFALEERVMQSQEYDQYEDHKADHERLLDDIRDIMDDYEQSRRVDVKALGERLRAWFAIHFKTHDARLHGYFSRRTQG